MSRLNPIEIEALARKDPLSYGVSFIDLLENKKWEVGTRAWIKEIYSVVNPYYIEKNPVGKAKRMVVQKSTQSGLSTMGIVRMFHLADLWPVRIMYTLPRLTDVSDFVSTRVDPMIRASERLHKKLGEPNSTHAKRLGDSYIYFAEMTVEPRMLPIDALFIDEVDLSDPDNMGTAMNRLDASNWKLNYFFSTPTLPNFAINAMYHASDKRQWFVRCKHCGHWQVMDWEKNLRVVGAPQDPKKVYYGCQKCNEELTLEHIQTGEWVPEYPERSKDTIGFHVSQMMTHPADELYRTFRDPQTKLIEFYRKRLGKPYELEGGSMEREDFLAYCFDEPYDEERVADGVSAYYMGVDQGNELQVVVAKIEKHSRLIKIVHTEAIPFEVGFDRIAKLLRIYRIRKAVIDADPNRHSVASLQEDFPGKVVMADYTNQRVRFKTKKNKNRTFITHVSIDRTAGFDDLFESFRDGAIQLPGHPNELSPDIELFIDHATALKRDVETRRTASGEKQVGVWRNSRPDHLGHAALYMKTAAEIDKGADFQIVVISEQVEEEEEDETEDEYNIHPDDRDFIYSILAEVPKEQLSLFLNKGQNEDWNMPFPLSFKYKKIKDKYSIEDIMYVVEWMLPKI